jgi:hypothetical protein
MTQNGSLYDEPGSGSNSVGEHAARGRELYLADVASQVRRRAGRCPQAKGVAQEIMFADRLNARPKLIVARVRARLTKSAQASTADVVLVKAGSRGVFGRYQVKDVTSVSGVRKTIQQVKDGKYRKTCLVGSPETVAEYTKAGGQAFKRMESTGVSSATATRVANEAGCQVRGGQVARALATDIGRATRSAAALSGGVEVAAGVFFGVQAVRGGACIKDVARGVAVNGAAAAGTSAVKTTAALGLRQGLHAVAERTAREGLKRVLKSNGATTVVFAVVEQGADTIRLASGKITKSEYAERTGGNVVSTGGALAGAALGTVLLPGVGTFLGGLVGGVLGQIGGAKAARHLRAR